MKIYVIVVYDITVDRIDQVRKLLRQYLIWIQNSAFEGELTKGQLKHVKSRVNDLIDPEEDSVIFFIASSEKWIRKEVVGIEKAEALVERKESEWRAKGYPEHLIRMGKEMIRDWIFEVREAWKLSPEKVQETAIPYAERMADRWIGRMYAAIK